MRSFRIELKDFYNVQGGTLEGTVIDYPWNGENDWGWKRPALLIGPGGTYWSITNRECDPIASAFLGKGFQTFILKYLCAPDGVRYPEQLIEEASAVDYIRKHAEEFGVNPEEVFVIGFSAGGHLAADLATEYFSVREKSGMDLDCRPTAVGLSYPVISAKYGHIDSYNNLLNGYTEAERAALIDALSLDERVNEKTPPAFLWHTAEDACVSPLNSLMYAAALSKQNIPFELHVYPNGWHGASTCDHEINDHAEFLRRNARWIEDCASFFHTFTKEKF